MEIYLFSGILALATGLIFLALKNQPEPKKEELVAGTYYLLKNGEYIKIEEVCPPGYAWAGKGNVRYSSNGNSNLYSEQHVLKNFLLKYEARLITSGEVTALKKVYTEIG